MYVLEDFLPGQTIPLATYSVTEEEIIEFAGRYDPQVFHLQPQHPRTLALGGLLASGWQVSAIFMRLSVDAYLAKTAMLTSPGVDELRWLAPVRADDVLSGEVVIKSVRPSQSRPDRGVLIADGRLWNQQQLDVFSVCTTAFVNARG